MANSKHKFIIKLKILLLLGCTLILSVTIAVNIILALYKEKITQTLNSHFFKSVAIKNIFYLPPNFIILNGLGISESIKTDKKVFNIPTSWAPVSLSNLFLNRSIGVSSLYCIGFTGDLNDLVIFLKDNPAQILDFVRRLPKQDFALTARQITIKSIGKDTHPINSKGYFNLKIKDRAVSAFGSIEKNIFSFKGMLGQDQIIVENFKLNGENINCQFWGKFYPQLAEFKGFILTGALNPIKKTSVPDICILDIDSRISFSFPRVEIQRLNFSINNNPVQVTADILLNEPFTCNLKLFSNFRNMDRREGGTLKNISLIASIISQEDKTIKVNGGFNMDFLEQSKESLPLEKVKLDLKNLVLGFNDPQTLRISAQELNLFSKTSTNSYNINLKDLRSQVDELNKTSKLVKLSSKFYDGRLGGRIDIEMNGFTPVISAVLRIKDVTANKLEDILIHFSKVYGKLSSQVFFINYPELTFKGALHIDNGYLNNFEFFNWLANLFNIPSLRKINFNTASADFIADKEGVGMYYIDMNSENVKIKGYFKLKNGDMVDSKIFLSLRRELLGKSPKFTSLLKLLDAKQEMVKFNFQLSGNLHGMNFRWLESDFKDELQKAIPDFAKRGFEEKVGKIIESIAKE